MFASPRLRIGKSLYRLGRSRIPFRLRRQLKDEDGRQLFTFNAAVAARAPELVGKHVDIGAFKDRLDVNGKNSLVRPPHHECEAAEAHERVSLAGGATQWTQIGAMDISVGCWGELSHER